ncbi:MAG: bifunctional demethylmenaquinone methyltransferase/2-methoxy-6-polyprenyl-1,4-benzoquinol methylase UbiE [Prevotellaceae bacterium]|jgi:demethylmenaquinone methyltransferase/2-methoxy-6-polyprenyl-1,4-benzoquinol methylase|nr:bifunctional demethylmenaquinone methyltransferase/2-methoxy-6-polyprenyl-1,4-benzoquinol methylase UbiE [Prevotellaceae bacterium]
MRTPAHDPDKSAARMAGMFNGIAPHYDFLNHLLSFGFDYLWRRRLVGEVAKQQPRHILDAATGTGDLALLLHRRTGADVTGIDIADGMLRIAKRKARRHAALRFIQAQAESLPFPDATFDAATVAFGVRNFERLPQALAELLRVLKPGGTLAILELSTPLRFPLKQLYHLYAFRLIPLAGRLISAHRAAYGYLPRSIHAFPQREKFLLELERAGFTLLRCRSFTGGVCCLYTARKK